MKNRIIIGIVVAAIAIIVGAKIMKKQCGTTAPSCCPCSMINSADTNTTESVDVE